ncbi:MAG: hypothetical protein R3B72_14090 [Polyangiaceae bacterium]
MSRSLKRIQRLVELRKRGSDAAQAALAQAKRQAAVAEQMRLQAEQAWRHRAQELAGTREMSAADFAHAHAHLQSLDARAQQARDAELAEAAAVRERHSEAVRADQELQKTERWSDRVETRIRQQSDRAERLRDDEIAARKYRGNHEDHRDR